MPRLPVVTVLLLLAACSEAPPPAGVAVSAANDPEFIGSNACRGCHEAEYADWRGSHHDLAMQDADADTVLGNFDGAELAYFGATTRFERRDDRFVVVTGDAGGADRDYPVAYTFGVYPLQQYLVSTPGGRLQALPYAWDARPEPEGGQRWYHLYPDTAVLPGDPLHWLGRAQNWNYMCAECHSTRLEVNYDPGTDTFATRWAEINVACEACHGPGSVHAEQAQAGRFGEAGGFPVDLDDRGTASWVMNPETGIAALSELPMRAPQQPEACGRCHARRGVIAAEYEYGVALEETHRVSLLDEGLYFPDGQIDDEVYVYGSFVQSRMYRAGVTCSDCHNPHSQQLVSGAEDPDRVCAQCHLPTRFATEEHRHHGTDVGCVDCHMAARVYMGVDARRDHSFRVPRPDISVRTGSPNACNACHSEQPVAWAVEAVRKLWGDPSARRPHFADAIHAGRAGHANAALAAVASDPAVPGIARGTALTLFSTPAGSRDAGVILGALADPDPLVRRGALAAVRVLPPERWTGDAAALLDDPVRSVRIEAARVLAPYRDFLRQSQAAAFERAAAEFRAAQYAVLSQAEAHAALGDFEASVGNMPAALEHYATALRMEPSSAAVRINYADALRRAGNEDAAGQVLREGIDARPESATLHHALGLSLVRAGRPDEGLRELLQAAALEPGNARYQYVAGVALNSSGQPEAAAELLEMALERFPADYDIAWALATILRDSGEQDRATAVAAGLAARYPDSTEAASLYRSLAAE